MPEQGGGTLSGFGSLQDRHKPIDIMLRWRNLTVWLLALWLPVQVFAAGQMPLKPPTAAPTVSAHQHGHHAAAQDHHAHHPSMQQHHDHAAAPDDGTDHHLASGDCTDCVYCHAVTLVGGMAVAANDLTHFLPPALATRFTSFIPQQQQRPPRTFRA